MTKEYTTAVFGFRTSKDAWAFSRTCVGAGFPSLGPVDGLYTVAVSVPTAAAREVADRLASTAPCVGYTFAAR